MTTATVDKAGGVGDMAVTSNAPLGGELVRRCNTCATPLTDEGLVDLGSLETSAADLKQVRALQDERTDLEARLVRAKADLKSAERRKDEQARVSAAYSIERKQARLVESDRLLAATKESKSPADGPCLACKTVFRGGHVDRLEAARAVAERAERRSQLAALARELVHTRAAVVREQHLAELAETDHRYAKGDPRIYRDHAESAAKRIPQIEEAIARAKEELLRVPEATGSRKR